MIWMTRAEMGRAEPAVSCVAGLYSPSMGIVDSGALTLAIRGDFEAHGGMLALGARFIGAHSTAGSVFCEK